MVEGYGNGTYVLHHVFMTNVGQVAMNLCPEVTPNSTMVNGEKDQYFVRRTKVQHGHEG